MHAMIFFTRSVSFQLRKCFSVFQLLVAFLIRVMQLIKVTQKSHRLDVMNTYLDSEDMKSQP